MTDQLDDIQSPFNTAGKRRGAIGTEGGPGRLSLFSGGRLSPKAIITRRAPVEDVADLHHIRSSGLGGMGQGGAGGRGRAGGRGFAVTVEGSGLKPSAPGLAKPERAPR